MGEQWYPVYHPRCAGNGPGGLNLRSGGFLGEEAVDHGGAFAELLGSPVRVPVLDLLGDPPRGRPDLGGVLAGVAQKSVEGMPETVRLQVPRPGVDPGFVHRRGETIAPPAAAEALTIVVADHEIPAGDPDRLLAELLELPRRRGRERGLPFSLPLWCPELARGLSRLLDVHDTGFKVDVASA